MTFFIEKKYLQTMLYHNNPLLMSMEHSAAESSIDLLDQRHRKYQEHLIKLLENEDERCLLLLLIRMLCLTSFCSLI